MQFKSRLQYWLGACWIGLLILSAPALSQKTDLVIEKSFNVAAGGTLTLNSDVGSIDISTHNKDVIDVRVIRDPDAGSRAEAEEMLKEFKVDFQQSGKDLRITGEYEGNWKRRRHGSLSVEFRVVVPEQYNVDLQTAGGSIRLDDLNGEVRAETSGGSLKFGNIKGTVTGRTAGGSVSLLSSSGKADIRTAGGSINIGDVDGDVDAHTAGGSISIDRAKGNVLAETAGGSISVDEVGGYIDASTSGGSVSAKITGQPQQDCRLSTSAGSVTIYMADNVAVDLDARASWGRIDCDFNLSDKSSREDESVLSGKINGGGPKLVLRTSSGKIRIRKL